MILHDRDDGLRMRQMSNKNKMAAWTMLNTTDLKVLEMPQRIYSFIKASFNFFFFFVTELHFKKDIIIIIYSSRNITIILSNE